MAGNIHSLGSQLTNALRPVVAGHEVTISINGISYGPVDVSSPPIGRELLTEAGLDFSYDDRVFFVDVSSLSTAGIIAKPNNNWIVVDSDGDRWRVSADADNHYWNWHGQNKTAYRLMTKQDA